MTPDARLLAAATIFSHGNSGMTPQKAAEYVAQLEAALTPTDAAPVRSTLVPVGWVHQMLEEIEAAVPSQMNPGRVFVQINNCRAQLAQFSEPV